MKFRLCLLIILIKFSIFCQNEIDFSNLKRKKIVTDRSSENVLSEEKENIASDVNVQARSKIVEKTANEAAKYFEQNSIDKACKEFIHNLKWRDGEIFPFVFDYDANVLAHGDDYDLVWHNLIKTKKIDESNFKDIINASKENGWVHYLWNNGFKSSFVRTVIKNNRNFIVGAGFFPISKKFDTERLVFEAAQMFKLVGMKETLTAINNPIGRFVKGGIYLWVYDLNGKCLAHGDNSALIGQNQLNLKDTNGNYVVRRFISVAKSKEGKGWINYGWKNLTKRAFIMRVIDQKTKKPYLIGSGYYTGITLNKVKNFVSEAIKHLNKVGTKQAFRDFSQLPGRFRDGLNIFVYDFKGRNLANGENPIYVGQNLINSTDSEGRPITKTTIEIARRYGKGSFIYSYKNASKLVYFETIETPEGKLIIGSGYYIDSKQQSVKNLVERGKKYLIENDKTHAFRLFGNNEKEFFHGDLHLFVYSLDGTALVNGIQNNMIWQNFANIKDEEGNAIIQNIISKAKSGGDWVAYRSRNANRRVFVELIEKENSKSKKNESFIIGSGYYL